MDWEGQKYCLDIDDYELVVEKQKTTWNCEQRRDDWKWRVNFHGAVVASGISADLVAAQKMAQANVPGENTAS